MEFRFYSFQKVETNGPSARFHGWSWCYA